MPSHCFHYYQMTLSKNSPSQKRKKSTKKRYLNCKKKFSGRVIFNALCTLHQVPTSTWLSAISTHIFFTEFVHWLLQKRNCPKMMWFIPFLYQIKKITSLVISNRYSSAFNKILDTFIWNSQNWVKIVPLCQEIPLFIRLHYLLVIWGLANCKQLDIQ